MPQPAIDIGGFSRRSILPQEYIDFAEESSPGFISQRAASWLSWIYARLRKRYGNNGTGSGLPFGQNPPTFDVQGTNPPGVTLTGVPILGSLQIVLVCTLAGGFGVSTFSLSLDGGLTFPTTGLVSGSAVPLPNTGLVATFANPGTWATDNVYSAPTPIPEVILGWLTNLMSVDVLRKRGTNTEDPQIKQVFDDKTATLGEIQEAANSQTGLFDLPVNENADSNVTTSGPLSYTETSPYVAADIQEFYGRPEDECSIFGGIPSGRFGGQ